MKLEAIIWLIVLALVLLLLFWAVPGVSRLFRRLRPKKPGWRAHWGLEGPMPKDYRGRNPWPSFASVADEQRMEFMTLGGKKGLYNTIKGIAYIVGVGGVFASIAMGWMVYDTPFDKSLTDWLSYLLVWLFPLVLFSIGYHYQRKEDQEEYPPSFIFDREKGTVTVPQFAKLPGGEFPFEDVEGYFLKSPANQFGLQTHFLQLVVHAPGGEQPLMSFILWAGPILGYEQALAHWSRLCQYMNKAEPLPNIPQLWEAMAHQLITERGWQGRAGREAAMDEVAHAFAQEMRAQEVKEGLGVEPHVDPANPAYEGPRSYEHYRHRYPTEA